MPEERLKKKDVLLAKAMTLAHFIEVRPFGNEYTAEQSDRYIDEHWRDVLEDAKQLNWALNQVEVKPMDTEIEDIFKWD